jgi:catechol 2,3-dioxygenase-like lactoylglutathione lyase family enzyme
MILCLGCSWVNRPRRAGSPKFERSAMRWLERYLTEGDPRLQHFAEITASLPNRSRVMHEVGAKPHGVRADLQPQHQQTSELGVVLRGRPERRQRLGIHKGTLLFENQPAAPGGERWGPVHYAFQVAPDELEDAADHVRSHGIDVFGPHQLGDVADAFFFYDPDDNLVEFFAYAVA